MVIIIEFIFGEKLKKKKSAFKFKKIFYKRVSKYHSKYKNRGKDKLSKSSKCFIKVLSKS
jgi:hypothetical protein